MIISWWSAGVTSAVATKLAIDEFGIKNKLTGPLDLESSTQCPSLCFP